MAPRFELGPGSRFLAAVRAGRGGQATTGPHFLLSGWLKLTVPPNGKGHLQGQRRLADLVVSSGVVSSMPRPDLAQFFVERGEAAVFEVGRGATEVTVGAARPTCAERAAGRRGVGRRMADFLAAMPALVPRHAAVAAAAAAALKPTPELGPQVGLQDLLDWFRGDPEPRRCLSRC